MGTAAAEMLGLETVDATKNTGIQDALTGPRYPAGVEIQRQWARPLVECWGQAHGYCATPAILHPTRAGLTGGNPPATPALHLNRRMRNRMYGGVRGLRE